MRILIILFVTIFIISCAETNQVDVGVRYLGKMEITCIDGVEYLKLRTGHAAYLSPHFKVTGKLYLCD